jgi:hypothetical protein
VRFFHFAASKDVAIVDEVRELVLNSRREILDGDSEYVTGSHVLVLLHEVFRYSLMPCVVNDSLEWIERC